MLVGIWSNRNSFIAGYSKFISVAVIRHHDQKQLGEDGNYVTLQLIVFRERKPGKESRAVIWSEKLE